MQDRFLTSPEVCERFRITEQTLRSWRKDGLLRAYKLGPRVYRYSEADIEAYIASAASQEAAQ